MLNNNSSSKNLTESEMSSENKLCSLLIQVQKGNDISYEEFRSVCAFIAFTNALMAVIAILGNSMIISAFYRSESLRTPSNLLLLGLSVCDFLVGSVTQPVFTTEVALVAANSDVACRFKDFYVIFLFSFSFASMLHVCLISVERTFAIIHPFKHHRVLNKNRVATFFLAFWICWTLLTVFTRREHGGGIIGYSRMGFVIFSAVVVFFINIRLWIEARRHSKVISRLLQHSLQMSLQSCSTSQETEYAETNIRRKSMRDAKAAKTVLLIIGFMVLCNLPLIATFTARKFYNVRGRVVTLLWFASNTVVLMPAILNPVIYFWRKKEFRVSVRRMFNLHNAVGVQPWRNPFLKEMRFIFGCLHQKFNVVQ